MFVSWYAKVSRHINHSALTMERKDEKVWKIKESERASLITSTDDQYMIDL